MRTNGAVLSDQRWELQRLVAGVGRRELPLQRPVDVPRRRRLRPDAGQRPDRSVRLPDSDRIWLSVGAQYKWDKNWKFDVGFAYIFAERRRSASTEPERGQYRAVRPGQRNYDASVTILSGQVTYSF